jgi:Aerobic-type carbon monoxide dehydrogenase, small subunit CoxS/CutS homologs
MEKIHISLKVNGERKEADVEPRMLLVHFIRDVLKLTGTHIGCDTNNCGACTVVLNGKAIKSCSVFAVQADGSELITIEGLSKEGKMHPIQEAFVEKFGLQCGYCTPGIIMTAYWFLNKNKDPTEEEIKQAISGNLCRCTGYTKIIEAIKYATQKLKTSF